MATDWEKEAQRAKELKENETFQKIFTYIRNRQVQTFQCLIQMNQYKGQEQLFKL